MGMKNMRVIFLQALLLLFVVPAAAIDISKLKKVAAKNNMTCIYVFGDSSVDPGNNNRLTTTIKANYLPYGMDLLVDGSPSPTGRFSNGKLPPDFIAKSFGHIKMMRGFQDPNIGKVDLLHGVSFASAGSGYDSLTANLSHVMAASKQLEYFRHYRIHLRQLVGEGKAEEIISNALIILSFGTNDFLQNYFLKPFRSEQFNVEEYQNYLISCMFHHLKVMHSLGGRKFLVAGVSPLGCFPLVKTLKNATKCDQTLNEIAQSFNFKIKQKLSTLKASLGVETAYLDIYNIMNGAINNPNRHGFTETSKGCCGTGTTEYGVTCRGLSTCADRRKFMYWDAVHPTEAMYKIIADEALKTLFENILD